MIVLAILLSGSEPILPLKPNVNGRAVYENNKIPGCSTPNVLADIVIGKGKTGSIFSEFPGRETLGRAAKHSANAAFDFLLAWPEIFAIFFIPDSGCPVS